MRTTANALVLLALGACADLPLESPPEPMTAAAAVPLVPPTCDRMWANPVDGWWRDPGKWFPPGAPSWGDRVCISEPGAYNVLLDSLTFVESVTIGGRGVAAALRLAGPVGSGGLQVDGDLRVLPGSAVLVMADGIRGISVGGDFQNFGTIRFTDGCGCHNGGYFSLTGTDAHHVNGGTLDLRASIVGVMNPGSTFTNTGAISVTGPHPSLFALFSDPTRVGSFEMQGGSITGTETIQVVNLAPYRPDNWTFIWSGGTIGTVPGDSVRSVLLVTELDVTLAHVALVGRLDLLGTRDWNPTVIYGDVGPGVELHLTSTWDHSIEFTSAAGIDVNEGALQAASLTLDAGSSVTIDIADAVAGSHDQLAVEGEIVFAGKLTITSIAPFIGGMCGHVVTIIADGATGVRGAFAQIFGLQQGPT